MGMHAIVGSYSDLKILQESAADADLVIAFVSANPMISCVQFVVNDSPIRPTQTTAMLLMPFYADLNNDTRRQGKFLPWCTLLVACLCRRTFVCVADTA